MIAEIKPLANTSGHPSRTSPTVGSSRVLNRFDTLTQLVERAHAVPDQRTAIGRRLHAFRGTVKQPHTDRVLYVGYCL